MRVAIVADDLTGAMDSAAPFADLGFGTTVLLRRDAPFDAAWAADDCVVAIDTDTRDAPPAAAAEAVRSSIARVRAAGTLPFKKIDSTLRGNVGAEIGAALAASGRRWAVVAPAAPAQGRVLRGGELFVDGQRMGERSLPDLLRAGVPGIEVRSLRRGQAWPPGAAPCLWVADAEQDGDLDRIAGAGLECADDVLFVGSSGLASAIARRLRPQWRASGSTGHRRYQRVWFVVGSYNARSAQQARALLARADVAKIVLPLAGATPPTANQQSARLGLLHVEGLDAAPALEAKEVAARLAQIAAGVVGDCRDRATALVMTGGDTARAILTRLGVDAITVLGSQYPGVIRGQVQYGGEQLGIVTKAGGFGPPDLFVRLADDLLA